MNKKELATNLEFLGGASDFDKYVRVGQIHLSDNTSSEYSRHFGVGDKCIVRNITQCVCSKKKLKKLHFVKRYGYIGPEYPAIMIGSHCIEHFQTDHMAPSSDGTLKKTHKNCFLCLEYYVKMGVSKAGAHVGCCRDCQSFYTPTEIITNGKYKGKTFEFVYESNPQYCKFIVKTLSYHEDWKNFAMYIMGCNYVNSNFKKREVGEDIIEPLKIGELETMLTEEDWPLSKTYKMCYVPELINLYTVIYDEMEI